MSVKKTNNGIRGGILSGDSHSDPSGGIKAIVTDDNNRPVLVENGEAIINASAVKKYHEVLSEINQSTGGRPIQAPVTLKSGGNVGKRNLMYIGEVGGIKLSKKDLLSEFISNFDNKKRFEISDKGMKIVADFDNILKQVLIKEDIVSIPLSGVVKHDKLFKAYPEFKSIPVNFIYTKLPIKAFVRVQPKENKIYLFFNIQQHEKHGNRNPSGGFGLRRHSRQRIYIPQFAHELQHLGQIREGFGGGSSPIRERNRILQEAGIDPRTATEDERNSVMALANENYVRQLGEIEAKDVERRLNLTNAQRKITPPSILLKSKGYPIVSIPEPLDWDALAEGGNIGKSTKKTMEKSKSVVELTTSNVTSILNWYALEGQGNWGGWTHYPALPVKASYDSFDTCHLRITLDKIVSFGGQEFNCITTCRRVPGKKLICISISELVHICKSQGVKFANEFMTFDKAQEISAANLNDAKETVNRFEEMSTYKWQEPRVRQQIEDELNNIVVNKIPGSPIPEFIEAYPITITNYTGKEQATFMVNLSLKHKNSKKTAGTYSASPVNVEDAVTKFTNERVANYSDNLAYHKATLAKKQTETGREFFTERAKPGGDHAGFAKGGNIGKPEFDKECYDDVTLIDPEDTKPKNLNHVYIVKPHLIQDGDQENDFIVEGTRIHSLSGDKHVAWEVTGFKSNGILLKHVPHSLLDDERPSKEVTFDQLKTMFENRTISIGLIQEGDVQALNHCVKAVKQCIQHIQSQSKND